MITISEMLESFRIYLRDDIEILSPLPGPIVMGGPKTKHIAVSFRIFNTQTDVDSLQDEAAMQLAQMVSRFPNPIQFYELGDPSKGNFYRIIQDPKIVIRQYDTPCNEVWTEPAEGIDPAEFQSIHKYDAHIRVVHEVVFKFGDGQL